jgi:hydrogenase small subunit
MAAMNTQATLNTDITDSAFVLAIEGSIPIAEAGIHCLHGRFDIGTSADSMAYTTQYLARHPNCGAVLTIGTCAAFGGIPAANGGVTHAHGFLSFMKDHASDTGGALDITEYRAIRAKTVNIPGCPPNPNWIVGTIAYILAKSTLLNLTIGDGIKVPTMDALRRPRTYYGERICNACDRFTTSLGAGLGSSANQFVGVNPTLTYNRLSVNEPERIGDDSQNQTGQRCLKLAGCKGSRTKSDCSMRKWHQPGFAQSSLDTAWCVGAGAPCQGCTQNFFPDRMSPFHYIR